jgi:hypothetical protein
MPDDLICGTEANFRILHLGETFTLRSNSFSEIWVMLSRRQTSIFGEFLAVSDVQEVKRNALLYVQHGDVPVSDLQQGRNVQL